MSIKALILLALLSRTPHYRDTETWEERENRLSLVADAIDNASLKATCQGGHAPPKDDPAACPRLWPGSRKTLAFLLVTQAVHETHLSAEVHHNRCRLEIGECDSRWYYDPKKKRRVYVQQSFSLWQIKKFEDIPVADWDQIQLGVDGTYYAAWHAARRLASAYRACGTIQGAISRYGIGHGCVGGSAALRMETLHKMLATSPTTWEKGVATQRDRMQQKEQRVATND